ncbi:hypothetical protein EV361DRAFT_952924 [Lentinula raphanica]|nr:hypothetical protein EV361DRAFT_952924 [Lentinula raphanica]
MALDSTFYGDHDAPAYILADVQSLRSQATYSSGLPMFTAGNHANNLPFSQNDCLKCRPLFGFLAKETASSESTTSNEGSLVSQKSGGSMAGRMKALPNSGWSITTASKQFSKDLHTDETPISATSPTPAYELTPPSSVPSASSSIPSPNALSPSFATSTVTTLSPLTGLSAPSTVPAFILFTFILLRVRGNLLITNGRWTLQHVRRCDSWQLVFTRDLIDTAMLRFAQTMVWFPIAYTILLLPSGIARFSALSNHPLSLPVEIFTAVTYNLTGLVNVLLLLTTHNLFPHNTPLPAFNTQRNNAEQGTMQVQLIESGRVTPFTLTRSLTGESYHSRRQTLQRNGSGSSGSTTIASHSTSSTDSQNDEERPACWTDITSSLTRLPRPARPARLSRLPHRSTCRQSLSSQNDSLRSRTLRTTNTR